MLDVLFLLIAGHFLCDFAIQSEAMAIEKSPQSTSALQKAIPWYWWLTAHAFIHAGTVLLITNNLFCALLELVSHWTIDYGKALGKYSILTDQLLHILIKITIVVYLFLI